MQTTRTQMDSHGRILIPATLRKELNYRTGDTFVLRVIDNALKVISLEHALKEAQDFVRPYKKEGESLVDEFLKMRKEEFKLENKGK